LLAFTRQKVKLRKQALIIVSLIAMKAGLIACFRIRQGGLQAQRLKQ
jgi:hypothetical protein